jgi:hypothetical protein
LAQAALLGFAVTETLALIFDTLATSGPPLLTLQWMKLHPAVAAIPTRLTLL